jgi:hypothetical protein
MLLIAILAAIGGAPAPAMSMPMPMQVSRPVVVSAPQVSRPVNLPTVREPAPQTPTAKVALPQQWRVLIPDRLTECNVDLHLLGAGDIFGIGLLPPPPPPALTC